MTAFHGVASFHVRALGSQVRLGGGGDALALELRAEPQLVGVDRSLVRCRECRDLVDVLYVTYAILLVARRAEVGIPAARPLSNCIWGHGLAFDLDERGGQVTVRTGLGAHPLTAVQ